MARKIIDRWRFGVIPQAATTSRAALIQFLQTILRNLERTLDALHPAIEGAIQSEGIDGLSPQTVLGGLTVEGGFIVNDLGESVDTRIEGDTDTSLIFVDASTNRVGIGTPLPLTKLDVRGGLLVNEDGGDFDTRIEGDTDTALLMIDASTDRVGIGTDTPGAKLDVRGSAIFNEDGADADFRIESDTQPAIFFVDASTNRVGFFTSTPGESVHLYSAETADRFLSMGTDPTSGPALNFGYSGNSLGRGSAFFNVRPDASATGISPSLHFLTENVVVMSFDNAQNVGIGTGAFTAPGAKLDVVGSFRCDSITNDTGLAHGTYTPAATAVANVAATANLSGIYSRLGNTVAGVVFVDIDPTAGGALTSLGLSLPVASNLGVAADLGGQAIMDNGVLMTVGRVYGDAANNRMRLDFYADAGAASRTWEVSFRYRVI